MFASRMKGYLDFSKRYAPASSERLHWHHVLDAPGGGLTLHVVGLNSALLAQDDKDPKQLRIGQVQLLDVPLRPAHSNTLTIVLSHHPLDCLVEKDRETIRAWMRGHADIHLHSHAFVYDAIVAQVVDSHSTLIKIVSAYTAVHGYGDQYRYSICAVCIGPDGKRVLRYGPRNTLPALKTLLLLSTVACWHTWNFRYLVIEFV